MFHRGFFLFRLIGTLVLIGLLVAGGTMLFRAGEAQGYAMGLAAAGKDLPVPAPYYGYGYGWMAPHFSPFGPLMGLFFFGLPLLFVFFLVGGFFRRMAWGRGHGHWGGPQNGQPWGPPPPWAAGQQPPAAPPQDPPVPGASTGAPK